MNNMSSIVTFGELLPLVGKTIGQGKLPRATQIRKDENEEVFIEGKNGEAEITVYKSGKLIYKKGEHETVSAVDRCGKLTYYMDPSHDEEANGGEIAGCECRLTMLNGVLYLASTVPLKHLVNLPWETVIGFTCEPRLAHNQEERESAHDEFRFGDEEFEWNAGLRTASAEDEYLEKAEPEMSEHDKMLHFLRTEAKDAITEKQSQVIDLHFNREKNQDEVAKELEISQPMVHKHLKSAYRNMEKAYYKNKK